MQMRNKVIVPVTLLLAVCLVFGPTGFDRQASADEEPVLFEIVLRTELVSIIPIYEQGYENDSSRIVGFSTSAEAYLINTNMETGILPPAGQELGTPIGMTTSEISFPVGVYADKSQEFQIAVGSGLFTMPGATMSFQGSSIIRWVQDPDDPSLQPGDVRWTDFSMGITETTGNLEGWSGHVVGTRLLIGTTQEPLSFQSGILIFRLTQ
jgi:hypothetical protein